ncbi:hypothetical protein [Flavobacterium sp. ov086]|uniref:hypothetical protein n=1 Tax=Flavobacterium sp. ov086 TaxID=1761785 RepID=UPI000B690EAB|nr:hypothetical protein [Flavobacterium sp. ov086]SNR31445.1 hypothetical protein SAMN04487979_102272 [Flavobacterium sp. ov086]
MGDITIIAKNFAENASGCIREDAAQIRNQSGKKVVQNGDKGINFDKNKDRKPSTDIRITKVEGPFDANGKLVENVVIGRSYLFKATPTRKPSKTELPLLKWAMKLDEGQKEIISGTAPFNKLDGEKIVIPLILKQDFEKAKVYAFYQKADDGVSIELSLKVDGFLYVLLYTSQNKRGDEMFRAAALTRKKDIENGAYFRKGKDLIILSEFQDIASIAKIFKEQIIDRKTKELSIWSHAAPDGPTGTTTTSTDALDGKQMTLTGWRKLKFNWVDHGDKAVANFFGCKTGLPSGKSFSRNISSLPNFKNVLVAGQQNSGYPSQYTNYRINSENGEDNFINENSKNITFQITYLIGGKGRSDDWNLDEQDVAYAMQINKNGKTVSHKFQEGKRK